MTNHYKRSKWQAERVAIEFAQKDLPVVIVNPTAPVGPRDVKPTPTGQVIVDFLNRATILEDVNLPGWNLHALKGQRKGEYAISVTGNYRLTFRFEKGEMRDVNLEDYH